VFFISDDQGACHYGDAGECRSTQSGTPIPPPRTPNLDLIGAYSTVFPIAHNSSSWCFPSLATIFTGRYQRSFGGQRRITEAAFATVPGVLRALAGDATAKADSFNAGNSIGGYCTLLTGKFAASLDQRAFDAVAKSGSRTLGRNDCVAGSPGSGPRCGTAEQSGYAPFTVGRATDVFNFLDMLVHRRAADATGFTIQPFFVWYAPRIPHQPLRAPQPIVDYLFGGLATFPLGGVMNLGRWCTGPTCAPQVGAFGETNFGSGHRFYASMWWVDDNIREVRRFLAAESAPHCIGADGRSRFDIADPARCPGIWGAVTPDLARNTVFFYFTDNGWHLPRSKHAFTENGYRTRLVVFDPRALPRVPSWDPLAEPPPPPATTSDALAHTVDLLPTALGLALGSGSDQACPVGPDGRACDGYDLRPHLATPSGGAAPSGILRHALCGHQTMRPTSPTRNRYLLTRPGSVGRCVHVASATCVAGGDCAGGEFCLGGRCAPDIVATPGCSAARPCPPGAACIGGACRAGPACLDDADCGALLGAGFACTARRERWCRNAPNVACVTREDCPACPRVNGNETACGRVCEPRMLKLYVSPGSVPGPQLVDLFLDPDEAGLRENEPETVVGSMSSLTGPYADAIRRLNCCIDDWWPEVAAESGTLCTPAHACPADLACNR
jgi:arylsulfatase A-like enzyme